MKYYDTIVDTIGDTPLVKLNSVASGIKGTILAKVEYFNPGHSVKDRIAVKMIEDAEARGDLKPGGTIIEGTSGNTGMGLALAAVTKGYKCIFTPCGQTVQGKNRCPACGGCRSHCLSHGGGCRGPPLLLFCGAEIECGHRKIPIIRINMTICPTRRPHYETTGPEIWRDTEGRITHYAAGVGTGGSMCGVGKYLKEQNPDIVTIGIDTYGSVFKKYKETGIFDESEIYPYLTEGIGEDILPANVDFSPD